MTSLVRRRSLVDRFSSPIAWALNAARWCQNMGALSNVDPSTGAGEQVATACADLGLPSPRVLAVPDADQLPLVCCTSGRGWGVVTGRTASGLWVTRFDSGEAHVTTLALHNACYAPGVRARDEAVPGRGERLAMVRRSRYFSGMVCAPMMAVNWENLSLLGGALVALLITLGLLRWLGRRMRDGRWPLFSHWKENQRLALQRDRILRQAIRSGSVPLAGRSVLPQDDPRST